MCELLWKPVTNNHRLNVMVQEWLSFRQIHILFSNVSSVILHSLSRNWFTIKIKFFTSISKSVVAYRTITVTNISNSIIKQYYGIIKLFKVLVIVKKKKKKKNSLAELIFFLGQVCHAK